ncbi:MAG: D-alanyl-D-alanine carboxypeptidase [Rubellimicrobium sp.]|nr:D-alanyl-D-alanine carboxypeptidase [Rubellimicrobium sp.]
MRAIAQATRNGFLFLALWLVVAVSPLGAAPYAALVMDARTGQVIHEQNADTRLHPASLTKMMTLYVAFVAIERGEISLDTEVRITAEAAAEPPSRLGLRTGQTIRLRYLLRAAAVKSANDAATAIGIAIAGSQEGYAARMNATAAAMGMSNTHFVNMNGLTREGHYSSARDMSVLGRHLVYDFPQYYNLFSRRTADAGMAQVTNTNSRFLDSYRGADGIKTGYTVAAGYNLVASAERDGVRIIATVFGGTSSANRNARVAELLDMGFAAAPANAQVRAPDLVAALDPGASPGTGSAGSGGARTLRVTGQVQVALRPHARPQAPSVPADPADPLLAAAIDAAVEGAVEEAVNAALAEALGLAPGSEELSALSGGDAPALDGLTGIATVAALAGDPALAPGEAAQGPLSVAAPAAAAPPPVSAAAPETLAMTPPARPAEIILTEAALALPEAAPGGGEVVSRVSTSDPRNWGINVGTFNSQAAADRILIQVAVAEAGVLDGGVRRIQRTNQGFDATILGLNRDAADLACRRLQARGQTCFTMGGA